MEILSRDEHPIIQILNSRELDNILGLEDLLMGFLYSNRSVDHIKEMINKNGYFLFVTQSRKGPMGYILYHPNQRYSTNLTKNTNRRFCITERVMQLKGGKGVSLISNLVEIAVQHAKRLHKRCIYEEINTRDEDGIDTSYKLGFREIGMVNHGPGEVYSIREKPLRL